MSCKSQISFVHPPVMIMEIGINRSYRNITAVFCIPLDHSALDQNSHAFAYECQTINHETEEPPTRLTLIIRSILFK